MKCILHFTENAIKANNNNNSTEKWKNIHGKVWNLFCQSWRLLVVPKCQNVTFIPKTSFPIILSDSHFYSTISFMFKVILWQMFITLLSFTIVSNAFCNEISLYQPILFWYVFEQYSIFPICINIVYFILWFQYAILLLPELLFIYGKYLNLVRIR